MIMKKHKKLLRIKKCRSKFTPYQIEEGLQMLGRTKAVLRAAGGATVNTIVYVVNVSRWSDSKPPIGRSRCPRKGWCQVDRHRTSSPPTWTGWWGSSRAVQQPCHHGQDVG
jgi:hypothetical protein